MRNEIIRKFTIITGTSLIVFFIISIFITSYINKKSLENNIINISNVIKEEMAVTVTEDELAELVDRYTKNQKWLEIIIATSHGYITKNSNDDSLGASVSTMLNEDELFAVKDSNEKNHVYTENGRMCYIFMLTDDIIVKTSILNEVDTEYIYIGLFFMILIIIVTLYISVLTTRKIAEEVMTTFSNITSHLKTINDGDYKEIAIDHKYEEVESVLYEINEANNNIYTSILKIKQEHDKVNFIINNLQQGIMIIDESSKILLVNDFAKNCLSTSETKIEGMTYQTIIENEFLKKQIEQALLKKDDYYFDVEDEKVEKIYAITINYLKKRWDDINNKVGLLIISILDVTEERTNDKLKAEFISNASHELKTPITSIRGFSELLLANKENYDEKTNKKIDVIYNESIRMKNTIDELLYLSNLEYRRNYQGEEETIYFKNLVPNIIAKLSDLAQKHSVSLEYEVDDITITEQASLMEHLITNLIENAIRYNKFDGKVMVKVKEEKYKIVLTVEDTGVGIEEKNINKIFERFYRVESSRNRNTGGTGLGLNIVKQICAIFNAKIEVKSKPDVGTTFKIIFNKPTINKSTN